MTTPMLILTIVLCVIAAFIAVLLIRTALFKPEAEEARRRKVLRMAEADKNVAIDRLSKLVRCKTVSHKRDDDTDWKQFERFIYLLDKLYPLVTQFCPRSFAGKTGMVYTWAGSTNKKPIVLMAHYDVVPPGDGLSGDPFSGEIRDGSIWGRGTLDTKGTLAAILEAAELLIRSGFSPERTVYFAFSGEEETGGPSCPDIVEWFEKKHVRPAAVFDEGGAVISGVFPGVEREAAMIGVAEKGQADLEIVSNRRGGHASSPAAQTSVTELAAAIEKISKHPLKGEFIEPVRGLFERLGPYASFKYRFIYANLWLFGPWLVRTSAKTGGQFSAMFRTTTAVTMLKGSDAANVLPSTAKAWADMRILPGQTVEEACDELARRIGDENITIEILTDRPPTSVAPAEGHEWDTLVSVIRDTWIEAIPCPYMMTARTDSRNYEKICDRIYRFSPYSLTHEDMALMHGPDEHLAIDSYYTAIAFYFRLMREI